MILGRSTLGGMLRKGPSQFLAAFWGYPGMTGVLHKETTWIIEDGGIRGSLLGGPPASPRGVRLELGAVRRAHVPLPVHSTRLLKSYYKSNTKTARPAFRTVAICHCSEAMAVLEGPEKGSHDSEYSSSIMYLRHTTK